MNMDEFFKKWNAMCDAHESCSGCPMWGDIHICIKFSELDLNRVHDIIEKWESEEE